MKSKYTYVTHSLVTVLCLLLFCACSPKTAEIPVEEIKVALRSVGNQVLLLKNDTTSLVLPVVEEGPGVFRISFEAPVSFDPADLHQIVSSVFATAQITNKYVVEVYQCATEEVTYSFTMAQPAGENIVPCGGRIIPEACYTIQVKFANATHARKNPIVFYVLVILVILFLGVVFYSKYHSYITEKSVVIGTSLGHFSFYPEQLKLVKEAQEIPLTQKECELLAIFIEKPNQMITREELTKRVWEDHGVVVGRSLDTYISKLRKKLEGDATLKITNIHGVGYKLEIF